MGVIWATVLLMLAAVIRDAPGPNDVEPGSTDGAESAPHASATRHVPLGFGGLLKFPQFWTIALAAALVFAILTTTLVSLIPFAQG